VTKTKVTKRDRTDTLEGEDVLPLDPRDPDTVWHMTVKEPEQGSSAEHKFVYDSETDAWNAYVKATQAGFEARVERVVRRKVGV
jgi:hypothetical protein